MKIARLMQIVSSHFILYLAVFLIINIFGMPRVVVTAPWYRTFFWLWNTRYISQTTRNIILLAMVVVVFPLVSLVYELERRKMKRKKEADIQNKKEI